MASSSSSHHENVELDALTGIAPPSKKLRSSASLKLYDVFINHRGADVKGIASRIYSSLQELKLRTFLDSREMEFGDSLTSVIETAICGASVNIAIFSKGYARSPWCLAELVLMLQSKAKIVPVFYDVEPSELRQIKNGPYADAFTKYEKKGRHLNKLEEWREALRSVSLISGYMLSNYNNDDRALCENVVSAVLKEIQNTKSLTVATYSVGLDEFVEDFEVLMGKEKENNKVIGIYGMGGLGKTTLAKELFNRKRSEYAAACFLFDVREASAKHELPILQMKLLKDLVHEDPPKIQSIEEGTSYLRDRLGKSNLLSFLIVIDDVDHMSQLDALLVADQPYNSTNSLVIVTTRDVGVLITAGITTNYHLKGMSRDVGRELFCWHAFGQPHPASGYEHLVDAFIDACGGLPLSLQILGGHVHGRNEEYWRSELDKVHKTLPGDIKQRLRVSFDALDNVEKQIFMDVACFFIDKPKSIAVRIWCGSGWNADDSLQTLKDKCLVEEIDYLDAFPWQDKLALRMHDHLRDLGREMASELISPRRLWQPQHLKQLEFEGFQNILAQTNIRCFHSISDMSMNSQITFFLGSFDDWEATTTSLLWLELDLKWNAHASIPSWIPLQNLQCLRICCGHLKKLWQSDAQAPSQLKELQLSQTFMEECPNLSGISNYLERLVLNAEEMPIDGWSLLESLDVHPKSLVLSEDTLSGELASNNRGEKTSLVLLNFKLKGVLTLNNRANSPMSSLEVIKISNQKLITMVLISGNHYPSLRSIKLDHMKNLIEVDFRCATTLNCLELNYCNKLKRLSGISELAKLVILDIFQCPELNELSGLSNLNCLEKIAIDKCEKLNFLELKGCKMLQQVSGMSYLANLEILNILDCPELEELPTLAYLSCLETITIDGCRKLICLELYCCENLKRVSGMSNLVNLEEFTICRCTMLEELPSLACLSSVERITITECGKLQNIALPTSGLTKLETLIICECPDLEELSTLARLSCLERITISRCEKLQNIEGIEQLQRLRRLQLSMGSNVTVRNCINRLQRVPSEFMTAIGRAVDGAQSYLDPALFWDMLGTQAVTKIHTDQHGSDFVEASLDLLEIMPQSGSLSAIIVCAVVVVEKFSKDSVYVGLQGYGGVGAWIFDEVHIDGGEWIVTIVITDQELITHYIEDPKLQTVEIAMDDPRGIKEVCMLTINKGQEWKTLLVLNKIVELFET